MKGVEDALTMFSPADVVVVTTTCVVDPVSEEGPAPAPDPDPDPDPASEEEVRGASELEGAAVVLGAAVLLGAADVEAALEEGAATDVDVEVIVTAALLEGEVAASVSFCCLLTSSALMASCCAKSTSCEARVGFTL